MTYLDRSLCFNKPAPQHGLHVSVTEVRVRLQNLTLHYLLQQEATQTPVEEGPHVLPIQDILSRVTFNSEQSHFKYSLHSLFVIVYDVLTHSDDTLLLHPARGVMELHKLHRHLVVDGQQELFSCFELQLQLSALFVRQFWGG